MATLAVALFLLTAAAPPPAAPSQAADSARIPVMLMTGLPLVWGEKGPFDAGSRPAAAYSELSKEFDFRPVDVLDSPTLGRGRLLLLAQPQRLAPTELAALDSWIRGGGRALILTDPALTWPSELPLGDIRRPPPVGLLAPLLGHWGLTLEPPSETGGVEADWNGRRILLDSPGRLRGTGKECVVEESWTAICRLGSGRARVAADADLMREPLWGRSAGQNRAIVSDWLHDLSGTLPKPAGQGRQSPYRTVLLLVLLGVLLGVLIRVLPGRRRTR